MKRFKLLAGDQKTFFWAYVFDSKENMYAWYKKYCRAAGVGKQRDVPNFGFDLSLDFAAMTIPFELFQIHPDGEVRNDNIGITIFHRSALGVGLIAHEMMHCAMWHDRLVNGNKGAEYGQDIGDAEERLAYLVGDYVRCFYEKAYRIGLLVW